MKIWRVFHDVDFEPGWHIGLYSTRELAVAAGNDDASRSYCGAYVEADGDLIWTGDGCQVVATLEEVDF